MKKIFLLLFFLFLTFSYFVYKSIGNDKYPLIQYIKSFIPKEIKSNLKEYLFSEDHHGNRKKNISLVDRYDLILEKGEINFEKNYEETFTYIDKKFNFIKFKSEDLKFSKHPEFNAIGTSYLELFKKNLVLVTGHGLLFYTDSDNLKNNNNVSFKNINSNIKDIIKYKEFYSNSLYGIKDVLIIEDTIYLSFVNQKKEKCWNTSILKAKMNFKYINFEYFFVPKDCVNEENDFGKMINSEVGSFWEGQSGGRLSAFKDDKILFSTGEFRYQTHAQNKNNFFGKIISIQLNSDIYEIISLGHRNPQGLYYDDNQNFIISTEHGPSGGDEININDLKIEKEKNFGWPISSYGEHYYPSKKAYKISPLHKSHLEYGYLEPSKYFTPAIGISQVVEYKIDNQLIYLIGALGKKIEEGDMSLHMMTLDNNLKIKNYNVWPINDRIRDIISNQKSETAYLYLESTGSIGILTKN
tara:strand:- start:131 stop:1534 length:1404 start_codon:yes stop_codon:yes gene_type:complete